MVPQVGAEALDAKIQHIHFHQVQHPENLPGRDTVNWKVNTLVKAKVVGQFRMLRKGNSEILYSVF